MTHQDKDLLLRDLSARLPYGVKANGAPWITSEYVDGITRYEVNLQGTWVNIEKVKPYLRPMYSMTEEEHAYYVYYRSRIIDGILGTIGEYLNWLNSHHFDYQGLIEKGLAIEATEDTYKINY